MQILCIGNLANNAYWNAKLLRAAGHEVDVLSDEECYVMSRPEWEEADFVPADGLNLFYPELAEFWRHGEMPPEWFAQDMPTIAMRQLALRRGVPMPVWFDRDVPLYEARKAALLPVWKGLWPEAETDPLSQIVEANFRKLEVWRWFLLQYDIVIGYGAGVFLPLLVGVPFFALEHGTLRKLPWEPHVAGRLCGMAYARAEHVFVTNADNIGNAVTLQENGRGVPPSEACRRVSFVNHPYEEHHSDGIGPDAALREQWKRDLDADFLIFWPTRHDWTAAHSYQDKGNQEMLSAFAALRAAGARVGLVCCAWGHDVEESRQFFAAVNVSQYVRWYPPIPGKMYYRFCRSADLVADQFHLGAFGGVAYKAMACGASVMGYVNPTLYEGLYPEMPPILGVRTADDIVAVVTDLMANDRVREIGEASRAWMRKYHRGQDLVDLQLKLFNEFLERRKS